MARTAVVLMAYGTPRHVDEILPYYTDIRRGRPPTEQALADLTNRYEAIGGLSPLAEVTHTQLSVIQQQLDLVQPGRFEVMPGFKHAAPTIEDTVDAAASMGFDQIVGLVLAPHYSAFSIGQYIDRLRNAAEPRGIDVIAIESWAVEPAFVSFIADDLKSLLAKSPLRTHTLFTAHSLPQRILQTGDHYPDELRASAEAIADQLGLVEGADWRIAWQSAGRTPDPWIGPDILEVIDELALDPGVDRVIVSAVGFVADHLEVLYDLDIQARDRAERGGLAFARTRCVNGDVGVLGALANRIHNEADSRWGRSQ